LLCEQAAKEEDPAKLLELIRKMKYLLENKRSRVDGENAKE